MSTTRQSHASCALTAYALARPTTSAPPPQRHHTYTYTRTRAQTPDSAPTPHPHHCQFHTVPHTDTRHAHSLTLSLSLSLSRTHAHHPPARPGPPQALSPPTGSRASRASTASVSISMSSASSWPDSAKQTACTTYYASGMHAECMSCIYVSRLARAVGVERDELLLEQVDGVLIDLVGDMWRGRRG